MRCITTVLVAVIAAGCAPVSTMPRPDSYYDSRTRDAELAVPSLFSGDAAVLSDEAIEAILDYEYRPPAQNRIALMPFGRKVWSEWSEELAIATEEMRTELIQRLVASPRVYDASYLPSILIPEQRSVPHLREAAARYQADLLLVYRTFCRSFERYHFFAADRSRAYCGVEAVLLDTRTGLVPFTSAAIKTFEARESDADINFRETVLRTELQATAEALGEVGAEIVAFLDAGGAQSR